MKRKAEKAVRQEIQRSRGACCRAAEYPRMMAPRKTKNKQRRKKMNNQRTIFKNNVSRLALAALLVAGMSVWGGSDAYANHPVFVEGNCLVPPAGTSPIIINGTCGDYDGDGRVGTAEDTDGDRVFGTIRAALNDTATGANQNGRVTIVTSGVFAEVVNITAANGNVQLEAAPGVEAVIDAVLSGDPGNGARQGAPGIIVDSPANRRVIIKNIVTRNWTNGIDVRGSSHVLISNCRVENNVNYGILVSGNAVVAIKDSHIADTGYRVGATGDFPTINAPDPGIGIEFEDSSRGFVAFTTITGSFGAGLSDNSSRVVNRNSVISFDNNPNFRGF